MPLETSPTSRTQHGNALIYAPEAAIHLGTGGADAFDFVVSCVVDSPHIDSNYNFHYDEAVRRVGPDPGYVPAGWEEIDPQLVLRVEVVAGF